MVAMRTRKATPAPTATPMMTAIGTDSVGEKQAQLTRDLRARSPLFLRVRPLPSWGRSPVLRPSGEACGGPGQAQAESNRVDRGGERVGSGLPAVVVGREAGLHRRGGGKQGR